MKKLTLTLTIITGLLLFYNFNILKKTNKEIVTTKKVIKIKTPTKKITKPKNVIIYLQPLGEVNQTYLDVLKYSIKYFYGFNCVIKQKLNFTEDILTISKTRYDANKILNKYYSKEYLIILTEKDIACKSGNYPEWGIFGYGFCPGKNSVLSTFRLKRNVTEYKVIDRLKKVALHEIGHNLGLEHCTNNKECMMNDADGTIKQVDNEKLWLCNKCREKIKQFRNPN